MILDWLDTGPARVTTGVPVRRSIVIALAALLASVASGSAQESDEQWLEQCRDTRGRDNRRNFCEVRVERMPATRSLRVDAAPNGGITVRASDRSDIEVHARIRARAGSDDAASALARDVRIEMDGATIRSEGPRTEDDESWHMSFVVLVPARTDLTLESQNGPVSVSGVDGRIEARTQNGPLSLRDISGDVRARTQNGPLHVELSGTRWNGAGLDAETQNGPVSLDVPEGYSAELEIGTHNGPFSTDVPLTVTRLDGRSRRIQTTLGNGGAPVRVVTSNGPATIRRR
ncbi:MAG: DUF4097 family beta strand repeat-containing protein [Gemmatimonadetes bacterium]|nr:DUF4097 family beta strand repeat-containing protein [Gemmatimonadota bacterium]